MTSPECRPALLQQITRLQSVSHTERMQDKHTRLTHSAGRTTRAHEYLRKVNAQHLRNTCKCTQSRRVSVARYVFHQLKSVTLSCDLNIYELFPGRCCVTPKLFILVSVGPTFGMMIEYENGCTFCCVKDNWWENVCLSPVCPAHLWFPHLISFASQSVLHL